MRIAAALCWYWEPVQFLERLVASLAGVVDELVALDGPWEHFAHRELASPSEQRDALAGAAERCGLPLLAMGGDELWETQVAKRSHLYSLVAERADWLLVIDGDEYVVEERGLRAALEATERDVGIVHNTRVRGRELKLLERTPRRVFRTTNGLQVREAHNGVVTDDGRWLAGPRRVQKEQAVDLTAHLRLRHEAMSRGTNRNQWARDYYAVRARRRIEVHS